MLAELNNVAVDEPVALDPARVDKNTVGAVQVFQHAAVAYGRYLGVMPGNEFARNLQVVIGGSADNRSSER
jgi:hypothetical protein